MSEFSNPYRPTEPVADPAMLFGRQDAADWLDLQISGNSRVLQFGATPLVGKTSFLRHIGALQLRPTLNARVALADARPSDGSAPSLNMVLETTLSQLGPQLALLNLLEADFRSTAPQAGSALRELLARVAPNVPAGQHLLLFVDDLHRLVTADMAVVAGFLTSLMPLLDECPALRLIFTANQDKLRQIQHPLLDGAPTFNLGAIPSDAAINMITVPVKGVLRFDYGVTRRIAETCSNHPYYLSLFCYHLLNRQVHDGWVNQQDFDNNLAEILDSPVEPFTQIWEKSTWAERAVLAGMAAIQGAHGPITGQEVIRFMERQHSAVDSSVVLDALRTLTARSVLVPMGAVSYRFHVELLRYWLREHTTPAEVIGQVNWGKAAAELKPTERRASVHTAPRRTVPTTQRQPQKRSWLLPLVIALLLLCGLSAVGGLLAARVLGLPIAFISPPTPTPTPTATPRTTGDSDPTGAAASESGADTAAPTPESIEPTAIPSPTPAIVEVRSLPSITYMGRDVDRNWRVYVMDANGANQTALTPEGEFDDTSPVWSPDGQKLIFVSRRDGNRELYVMDVTGENVANLTRHPADDWTPAWSPDGTRLAFSSFRDGSWEIYLLDTACLGEPESCPDALTQLTSDGNGNLSPAWAPDGSRLAYNSKVNGNWDIFTMAADGSDIRQVTTSPENDLAPIWSPDGSQLTFESNRDGNVEVYVIGAQGGTAINVSSYSQANDHGPVWSPDGQQLVFYSNRSGNWDIFAVPLTGGEAVNLTNTPTRDEQTPAWRP